MLTVEMAQTLLRETDTKSFLATQDTPSLRLAWDWPTVNAKNSRKAQGKWKDWSSSLHSILRITVLKSGSKDQLIKQPNVD